LPKLEENFSRSGIGGGRMNIGRILGTEFMAALKDEKGEVSGLLPRGMSLKAIENNPYLISQGIAEGIKDQGKPLTDQNIAEALAQVPAIADNAQASRVMADMIKHGYVNEGPGSMYAKGFGPQMSIEDANKKFLADDPETRVNLLIAAFRNLGDKLGDSLSKVKAEQLDSLIAHVDQFSAVIANMDEAKLMVIANSIVGVAKALVALGVTMAMLEGLALIFSPTGLLASALVLMAVSAKAVYDAWDTTLLGKRLSYIKAGFADLFAYIQNTLSRWSFGMMPRSTANPYSMQDMLNGDLRHSFSLGDVGDAVKGSSLNTKPVTLATNISIDGKAMASQITNYIMQMLQNSNGSGSHDGMALPGNVDSPGR
jgi:hypothetical protein